MMIQSNWIAQAGWTVRGEVVTVDASSDRRLTGPSAPASFQFRCKTTLKAGRSAGVLFGMSADGKNGYVARMDSRLGQLILAKIGPWPKEDRIAIFPWEVVDGQTATFRIEAGSGSARVFVEERGKFPVFEARNYVPAGDRVGLYGLDAMATFRVEKAKEFDAPQIQAHVPEIGTFTHIFDQSPSASEPWYVNDHCLIDGPDGWHLYGITHAQPANPMDERDFAHATSASLTETSWARQPFALRYDPSLGENHLWAPHVIRKGDTFTMFYCAGSRESNYKYRIHTATSKDLHHWVRNPSNPLFEDFFDARDPMVVLVDGTYYLYYTANLDSPTGNHVVNVRTSKDLKKWSPARVALVHPEKGTFGGPTESPFVVPYKGHFYLFVGPDPGYHGTKVYRSSNPYSWSYADQITGYPAHASEIVQDRDGRYYATDAGWDLRGVYLAPLTWKSETAPVNRP